MAHFFNGLLGCVQFASRSFWDHIAFGVVGQALQLVDERLHDPFDLALREAGRAIADGDVHPVVNRRRRYDQRQRGAARHGAAIVEDSAGGLSLDPTAAEMNVGDARGQRQRLPREFRLGFPASSAARSRWPRGS